MRKSESKVTFETGEAFAHLDQKIDGLQQFMIKNAQEQNDKFSSQRDEIKELNVQMVQQLTQLNTNMANVMNKLDAHEQRITELEKHDVAESAVQDHTFKASGKDALVQCIPLLVKSLTVALVVIGSLAGCSQIIAKIFTK